MDCKKCGIPEIECDCPQWSPEAKAEFKRRRDDLPDLAQIESAAGRIINALAPVTRRDEWWFTFGPYEIIQEIVDQEIAEALKKQPPPQIE